MRDDPELTHAVIHALNEWLHETWTFDYEDRIFATPVITLPIVDKAIEELEWCRRAGRQDRAHPARARCPAYGGSRSFGVRRSSTRSGRRVVERRRARRRCTRPTAATPATRPTGPGPQEMLPFRPDAVPPDDARASGPIEDTMAALDLPRRAHPLPRAAGRCRSRTAATGSFPFLEHLEDTYKKMPHAFDEDPVEAFKRNVCVSPFHEDDIAGLIERHRRRPPPASGPTSRTPRAWPSRAATSTTCPPDLSDDDDRRDHGRQPRRRHAGRRDGLSPQWLRRHGPS